MKYISLFFLLNACLLLTACKEEPVDPLSQLPPATMTGENTFGCLVNGEVWMPKGKFGVLSNLTKSYNYGTFNVSAYRSINGAHGSMGIFVADTLHKVGDYPLNNHEKQAATFKGSGCTYHNDGFTEHSGSLKISRLNLSSGVIAGTFEFTLVRPGCDTIRVTEGRFDLDL